MGQTTENFYPAVTGQDLGTTTQRWDLFAQDVNISGTTTLTSMLSKFNKIRFVDGTTFTTIQAAHDDLPSTGGVVVMNLEGAQTISSTLTLSKPCMLIFGAGTYTFSSGAGIRIASDGVVICGLGYNASVVKFAGTSGDHIANVTGSTKSLLRIADIQFEATGTVVSGALFNLTNLDQGTMQNVRVVGNFFDVFNHINSASGNWTYDNILVPGGVTINSLWRVRAATGTTGSIALCNIKTSNTITFSDAGIILDTGVDTFKVVNSEIPKIVCKDTLVGADPQWVHITNSFIEAGVGGVASGIGVDLQAVRDFRFTNSYIATSTTGIQVGAGARDVDISHNVFTNLNQSAVTIASGAVNVHVIGNDISETGIQTNNTYDAISVPDGADDFDISGNTIITASGNAHRYGINIANTGSNRFSITNNLILNAGTSALNNASTGATQFVWGNMPNLAAGVEKHTAVPNFSNGLIAAGQCAFRAGITNDTGNLVIAASTNIVTAPALVLSKNLQTERLDVAVVNGANANVSIGDVSFVKLTGPTGAFSISGFTGGANGRRLTVYNSVAFAWTITNNATSTAANRILTLTGGDVVLAARQSAATFVYDSTQSLWILVSQNG